MPLYNTVTGIAQGGTGQATDPLPPFMASDAGFLAWNYDPLTATTGSAPGNNTILLTRVNVRTAISCTNVLIYLTVGGSGLTTGQNFAGLYSSAGTRIGVTADQTTNWAGTGLQTMPLVSGPFALTPGFYWVGFLSNESAGAVPSVLRQTGPLAAATPEIGLTVSQARSAINGTGTALPSSITPASNTFSGQVWWTALS